MYIIFSPKSSCHFFPDCLLVLWSSSVLFHIQIEFKLCRTPTVQTMQIYAPLIWNILSQLAINEPVFRKRGSLNNFAQAAFAQKRVTAAPPNISTAVAAVATEQKTVCHFMRSFNALLSYLSARFGHRWHCHRGRKHPKTVQWDADSQFIFHYSLHATLNGQSLVKSNTKKNIYCSF